MGGRREGVIQTSGERRRSPRRRDPDIAPNSIAVIDDDMGHVCERSGPGIHSVLRTNTEFQETLACSLQRSRAC